MKQEIVNIGDDWFDVVSLPGNVYALVEDGHIQNVRSFLITGSSKALLFDTGMGIGNILKVVRQLTDLEVIVVNSHSHFDHIGDNWRFSDIRVFADDYAVNILKKGIPHKNLLFDSDPELFTKTYPEAFLPDKYLIKGCNKKDITLLHDEDIIDLGNRKIKVLHTPGHSEEGIMLMDSENRILFTGDTFCEWMIAFFDSQMPDFGLSSMEDYAKSMRKISRYAPNLDYIYPSHGKPLSNSGILSRTADAFEKVIEWDMDFIYEDIYGSTRRVYEFKGFSIWTN